MKKIKLTLEPFPGDQIQKKLAEYGICVNPYAEEFLSHPSFSTVQTGERIVAVASLREIGLASGASLPEIFQHLPGTGLRPCDAAAGLFLRLAWRDQPQSQNSLLSGTHAAPDKAVTVLSEPVEDDDAFPKGLYLRNVDGRLWLRGYVCDAAFRFSGDDLFAFETDCL